MLQDVLYTVCNPIGNVLRIVIFKRNGIQAMVEYPYWIEAHRRISNRELCCENHLLTHVVSIHVHRHHLIR